MMRSKRCSMPAIALAIFSVATLLLATSAMAETVAMKIKRRETGPRTFDQATYMYWQVQPQSYVTILQTDPNGKVIQGGSAQEQTFKRIVKKEPKYQSDRPFRGVLKLGSQEYAFALDEATEAEKKSDAKKPDEKKAAENAAANADSGSVLSALSAALFGAASPSKPPLSLKGMKYNRLYFDANHNGDLTDDKVIELPTDNARILPTSPDLSYRQFEFPRTDVTIEVDDGKLDYSFYLHGYTYTTAQMHEVIVQMSSAVCREGDITLAGKKHHIVLLDHNSNGRFDDEMKISPDIHMSGGGVYAMPSDELLIDPNSGRPPVTTALTKTISIDGELYDVKVTPAGDQLTLTKSTAPMGSVKNGNESFTAMIYSDKGFFKIDGTKDKPVAVPEGDWKLYSYTITSTAPPKAVKTEEASAAKQDGSLLNAIAGALLGGNRSPALNLVPGAGPSTVSASGTEGYQPVTVRAGETVELPFGPPYTPKVEAGNIGVPNGQDKMLRLNMTLVGVAGEGVTNITSHGGRPSAPAFTIKGTDGKVVHQGDFEYG